MAEPNDPLRDRNLLIAASVGGFLLPLAGVIGAVIFYVRGDERSAWIVFGASVLGILLYLAIVGG